MTMRSPRFVVADPFGEQAEFAPSWRSTVTVIHRPVWVRFERGEIPRSYWRKKNPDNRGTEQPVNGKFMERVKGTQDYVECDPSEHNKFDELD